MFSSLHHLPALRQGRPSLAVREAHRERVVQALEVELVRQNLRLGRRLVLVELGNAPLRARHRVVDRAVVQQRASLVNIRRERTAIGASNVM